MTLHHAPFKHLFYFSVSIFALLSYTTNAPYAAFKVHAHSLHGQPKYPQNFTHFEYTNPQAPKGGTLARSAIGTYDSFNGFISKGSPAQGLNLLYDSLTVSSLDEPFTHYGLIAQWIETAPDLSWVRFHLHPKARFHDGSPILAEDVVFTFNTLKNQGKPHFAFYYAQVKAVIAENSRQVRFDFMPGDNRELALIVGEVPILPKAYWATRDFNKSDLTPPLGSGPYRIKRFKVSKNVVYERIKDYWAQDLGVNRGRYNFDEIRFEYFLDDTVALEAFQTALYNLRIENHSKRWATLYQGEKFTRGDIHKVEIPHQMPAGMQGFGFNLRRPVFQERTLRHAMSYALDFEWCNKNLFFGQYQRTRSYFQNTKLAASKRPSPEELILLNPFKTQLPPEVFTQAYEPPKTQGQGKARANLRIAQTLLRQAGYRVENKQLISPTGEAVRFEFLLPQSGGFERILLPFKQNLAHLGIEMRLRKVDVTQYIERLRHFDYDMIVMTIGQSLSPGNEQRNFWHSSTADVPDSLNRLGIKHPVVDHLVERIIQAPSRADLVTRARALDRVLQWQHYIIPNWYAQYHRVAHWNSIVQPSTTPPYGLDLMSWWAQPEQPSTTE